MNVKEYNDRCRIRLFHGDCVDAMREMEENQYKLAIVDPPYGIGNLSDVSQSYRMQHERRPYNNKYVKSRLNGAGKLADRAINQDKCEWDQIPPNSKYFDTMFRISENQIIWGGNYFNLPPTRGIICWDKEQPWPNFSAWEMAWTSFDKPAKLFRLDNKTKDKIHPTQKPVALYKWLLVNYAKEGDNILDTHGGSMSIAIACWDLKFDLDLYELDEDYYSAGVKRFEEYIAQEQFDF